MGYTPLKLLLPPLRNIGELVFAHEPQKYKKGIENTCTQFSGISSGFPSQELSVNVWGLDTLRPQRSMKYGKHVYLKSG